MSEHNIIQFLKLKTRTKSVKTLCMYMCTCMCSSVQVRMCDVCEHQGTTSCVILRESVCHSLEAYQSLQWLVSKPQESSWTTFPVLDYKHTTMPSILIWVYGTELSSSRRFYCYLSCQNSEVNCHNYRLFRE